MFPQGLIDQWLSKPREGRRSVQEDPKATPAILENIRHLEAHCAKHPYEVYCASSLHRPPFALYALADEASERARLARPPAPFTATPAYAERPDSSPSLLADDGRIGGRYTDSTEHREAASVAAAHLLGVTTRLAAYLEAHRMVHGADNAASVAQLVVRIVAEAATAAAVRRGVAAQVEAEERAAFQRQQSQRRLQLRVSSSRDGTGEFSEETQKNSIALTSGVGGAREDGGETAATDYDAVARPIADYRRDSQGLLSMVGLLWQRWRPTSCGAAHAHASVMCVFVAPQKRARDESAASSRNTSAKFWTQLREDGLRRCFGTKTLPPPPSIVAAAVENAKTSEAKAGKTSTPLTADGGWAELQLQITERDVLFALQKVLGSATASHSCTHTHALYS